MRKPRGLPSGAEGGSRKRASFCCRADGCRRRSTPPLLLFLGRRVYVSVVVVLVACLAAGPNPPRLAALEREVGVSPRTVRRWVRWWREEFARSPLWRERQARLVPPVDGRGLPGALLDAFQASSSSSSSSSSSAAAAAAALVNFLRFVTP